MPHAKPDLTTKICEAALRLAAKRGWENLTLEQIAKAAQIPLARAQASFADKNQILPALVGWIDERTAEVIGKINAADPPRDRVFEVMMGRFDLLQKYRAGILAIFKNVRRDPEIVRHIIPAQLRSMRQMITLARLTSQKIHVPVIIFGLLAVHYRTLWEWQKDTTSDMAKTMATLDKSLRCGDKIAGLLSHNLK
jgi:AcrR family transcriptional regulator